VFSSVEKTNGNLCDNGERKKEKFAGGGLRRSWKGKP
jgi:hypothetical protein